MKSLDELVQENIFGPQFEQNLFNVACYYSEDYEGANWESKQVEEEEDGFYLSISNKTKYEIRNSGNFAQSHREVVMNSATFSLTIFCMTCNLFANQLYADGHEEIANDYFDLFHYVMRNGHKILSKEDASDMYAFLD